MDYCSTCRRHLNGALVCPGCGAYAPDIAPLPGGAPALIATAAAAPVHDEPVPYRYSEYTTAPADTPDESFDTATASGRAARRRQRERWKKTQRRALVATAVALVGGGLTVSSMNRQSTDRAQASSAPDREPMGAAEEEIDQPTAPESTPSDAHRGADGTRTPSRSSADRPQPAPAADLAAHPQNAPRQQSAAQAQAAPVQQRPAHQDAPTPAPSPSTGSSPDTPAPPADSGSASKPSPAPAPSSPSPSAPSGGSSAGSGSSSDATSPAGLCLLGLLCVK